LASGNNLNISLIDNLRCNGQVFNTTNTQTWYKTHLTTDLLHMSFSVRLSNSGRRLSNEGTSGHLTSRAGVKFVSTDLRWHFSSLL